MLLPVDNGRILDTRISNRESPRLVGMNLVGEVLNGEESFVGFGDWDVVER
jgi:hypothetical protein